MTSYSRLLICFQLEPASPDIHVVGAHGKLRFDDGDAFSRASRWCKLGLDEFLYRAIEEYLMEVQAAMGEERTGES